MRFLLPLLCLATFSFSSFASDKIIEKIVSPLSIGVILNDSEAPQNNSSVTVLDKELNFEKDAFKLKIGIDLHVQSKSCEIESIEGYGLQVDHYNGKITAYGIGEATKGGFCRDMLSVEKKQLKFDLTLFFGEKSIYKLGNSGYEVEVSVNESGSIESSVKRSQD